MDIVWIYFLSFLYFCGVSLGLECWQCIADDCHLDPASNYKATKKKCMEGESCQKVIYRGRDTETNSDYLSITRSCSLHECIPRYDNCSENMLTNPGCMIRYCCHLNLCNTAAILAPQRHLVIIMTLAVIGRGILSCLRDVGFDWLRR